MPRFFYALLVVAALFVPVVRTSVEAAPARTTVRIVDLINAERAAAGLGPLTVDPILANEAQRFSGVQAQLGKLSHRGTDGTNAGQRLTRAGYRWRFYGENLAAGQTSAEDVVRSWMNSPAHRANVLSPKATQIGIGHTALANDPNRYYDYFVMEIARPR